MKRTELQSQLAMTVVLISGGMLFLTLFMGYAVFRTSAETWPPVGTVGVQTVLPWISTTLILLSSWTFWQMRRKHQLKDWRAGKIALRWTATLGTSFMLSQSLLWWELKRGGLLASSGIFASILYGFTWIHALHMVLALAALGYLWLSYRSPEGVSLNKVINIEKLWHFLGVIWILMFLVLFIF